MKNVTIAIFLVLAIASCGSNDKNVPLVKKEFKTYVLKTFDDPSSFQEIVEIAPCDTISLESIKRLAKLTNEGIEQYRGMWKLKDSVRMEQMQAILNGPKPKRQPTYSEAVRGSMIIDEINSILSKTANATISLYNSQARLNKLDSSLVYHPAIYVYEIKYRNQKQDGLKLESAYAYIDSLAGFKTIVPQKNDSGIISDDYYKVFIQSKECLIATNKVQELYEKKDEKTNELLEYTKQFQ